MFCVWDGLPYCSPLAEDELRAEAPAGYAADGRESAPAAGYMGTVELLLGAIE
jgi:hypothetical protein